MDAWVVEVLRVGYRIPFDRRPPVSERPLSLPAYSPQSIKGVALTQELQTLLRKGAVEPAPQSPGFYSRIFLVQKASGSWRPIIDLSTLNDYVTSSHFHMETPQSILRSIRPGDWMVSLDLQDAYLQVPVHHDSLRGRRKDVPVQGPLFRSHNRAPSLHENYVSGFRHPPQVWGQDASVPGRMAHPGLFGARLFTVEGQAPDNMHRTWHPGQPHEIVSSSHSITSVSRHGDSVSAFYSSTYSSTGQQSPAPDQGVSVDPISSSVPLASTAGPLVVLTLLVSGGMLRMRLLQLCLKDQWDFLDDQFQVSWSPLCREDLLWWARVAQLREGVCLSHSQLQTSASSQTPQMSVGGP